MVLRLLYGLLRIFIFGAVLASVIALPRAWVVNRYTERIHTLASLPTEKQQAAIVFGAGLRWDGRPSIVLSDRVRTAVLLYQEGLVDKIIMSGTQRSDSYDEPTAMAEMAANLGVPPEAIVKDSGGTRTIETCRHAVNSFAIQSAYLVSQEYHLPRALATCSALDIEVKGVAADMRYYRAEGYWRAREIPATFVALWESFFYSAGRFLPTGRLPS